MLSNVLGVLIAFVSIILLLSIVVTALSLSFAAMRSRSNAELRKAYGDLSEAQRRTKSALKDKELFLATRIYEQALLQWERGDDNQALHLLTEALKLAPDDAAALKAVIRANLGAGGDRVNKPRPAWQALPL